MNIFESLENLNVSEECFEEIMEMVEALIKEADHHANKENPVVKITDKNYKVASGKSLPGPFNKNHVGQYIVYNKDTDASYLVTPDNWKKSKIKKELESQGKFYESFEEIMGIVEGFINEFNRETVEKVKRARKDDVDFATNQAAVINAKATMARKKAEDKPTPENIKKANELTRLQVANAHNVSDKIKKYARNIGLTDNYAGRHDLDKDDVLPTVRDSERSYRSNAEEGRKKWALKAVSYIKPEVAQKRKEDAEASVTKKNLKESLLLIEEYINELKKEAVDKVRNTRKAQRDLALNNFTNIVADVVDTKRSLRKKRGKVKTKGLSKKHSELIDQDKDQEKRLALNVNTPVEANKKYRNNLDLSTKWYARHGHYGDAQNAQDEKESTVDPEKVKKAVDNLKQPYREAAKQITPHWKAEKEAENVVSASGRKKLETKRWQKELDDWVNRDK